VKASCRSGYRPFYIINMFVISVESVILTVVSMKSAIFCDRISCRLV
jgi:hypothetical protein